MKIITRFKKGENVIPNQFHRLVFGILLLCIFMIGTSTVGSASQENNGVDLDQFKNNTPSEQYISPMADSFFHGYSTVTYADFGRQFSDEPTSTQQILVSGRSLRSGRVESGFQFDSTLIFGAAPSSSVLITTEVHFVRTALDPIITEAKIRWSPNRWAHQTWRTRLVIGRYWWPFGIHNEEWFSNVNRFSLISPAAAEVLPAHYNETGIMLEGEWAPNDRFAFNGLLSLGNGVASFDLLDNVLRTPYDENGNRTVTTRVGVFPFSKSLQIGLNFATGVLREGLNVSFQPTDPRRFGADFMAYGIDGTYRFWNFETRSYWYWSEENLEGASTPKLDRNGGTLEIIYNIVKKTQEINGFRAQGRVGTAKEESLTNSTFRRIQYAFGFNWLMADGILLKLEYFLNNEAGISEIDNNGFVSSVTANF
jgi:hypothetical protein